MVVNTGTTIGTFLMVFVIQNSQNRDGLALQIKLDEIIRAVGKAQNSFIDLEERSQEELDEIKDEFAQMAVKARNGKKLTSTPPVNGKSQKNAPRQEPNHWQRIESVREGNHSSPYRPQLI